jgi:hypothetical protein
MLSQVGMEGFLVAGAWFDRDLDPTALVAKEACRISPHDDEAPPRNDVSAGKITIDIPTPPSQPIVLTFSEKKQEYETRIVDAMAGTERFEKAGTLIQVRADGATVPAFTGEVRSADDVQFEVADNLIIDRQSEDIVVRWSKSTNDLVQASLLVGDEMLSCTFGAGAPQGTIPGVLVGKIVEAYLASPKSKVESGSSGVLSLTSSRSSTTTSGSHDIGIIHGVSTTKIVQVAK